MKQLILLIFIIGVNGLSLSAQTKQLVRINSIITKETIDLKYKNGKLIYLSEKGTVTFNEFTFKYDKAEEMLVQCTMNKDRGELITVSKFTYNNDYITEEITSSGKQVREKKVKETQQIHVDEKGRLTKTVFADGKPWEEFIYDDHNNIITYTQHSTSFGQGKKVINYLYNNDKSAFTLIPEIPSWFWATQINNMRWCGDFIGKNNPKELTLEDPRYGTETIEISYEYDAEGYPVKQFYDDELVKEFIYVIH